MDRRVERAIKKPAKSIANMFPVITGVVLLIGLINTVIPKSLYSLLFSRNIISDSIVGSSVGSILAGNPVTSYILGGEFLKNGTSLIAVTSFIVAWVTVGIVQSPAEAAALGKRFALYRNLLSFIFSIAVAIVTVFIVGMI